ncbi:MAG TPA: 16S rRNA (guanine(966)-N(2))-methyltransferase RsmD [Crocinitomicaceae bacterium]|nr:16S rRNA (guanine(966)-N(2))-methyltransferase RsmD [Crocinitomicaceae bacterium]
MRIIRGKYKTRYYKVPKSFPSRPTTDFAKEGLFNILEHQYMGNDMEVLDLCAGTGNISIEFLSRECGTVVAVDNNYNCIRYIKSMGAKFDCNDKLSAVKSDVLKFLNKSEKQFDLIFADPPYAYKHHAEIAEIVFQKNKLKEDGVLIIEHGKETSLENITHFQFMRTYGNVHFSFFELIEES